MDNADLRQIMEKTDMAQAAQHQEEQRHGQLQLEMQVGLSFLLSRPAPSFLPSLPPILPRSASPSMDVNDVLLTLSFSLPPSLPPSLKVQANMDLVQKMVEVQKDNHELREKLQRLNQMMHAREEEIANVLAKHASPNSSDYPSLSSLPPMPSSSPPPPPVVASPEKKKGRGGMF